jgi:Na+-driven multidrug efflux pump
MRVAIGVLLLLLGLPALGFAIYSGVWTVLTGAGRERETAFWIAIIFLPLASGAVTYGVRILRGRDEVISPFVLRLTGVVLLVLPVLALFERDYKEFAGALLHAGMAFGCFALARQREGIDPAEPR